jgi:hypothetical protein
VRLYEFASDIPNTDALATKFTAIISQFKKRLDDTNTDEPTMIQSLVNLLNQHGLDTDEEQIRALAGKPPLNNLISNIQGDQVVWVDHDTSSEQDVQDVKDKDMLKNLATSSAKTAMKQNNLGA